MNISRIQSPYWTVLLAAIVLFAWTTELRAQVCLDQAREYPEGVDETEFDVQFDKTRFGASFSCDLLIRASEARDALAAFRFGVLYDSVPHIEQSVSLPLVARISEDLSVEDGPNARLVEIGSAEEFIAFKNEYFDPLLIALIACSDTFNVGIVKSRSYGFEIGAGQIWFQPELDNPPVRVTAVSLSSMSPGVFIELCAGVPRSVIQNNP